jgi:drug/metabolite transporter (DMT)-like permease
VGPLDASPNREARVVTGNPYAKGVGLSALGMLILSPDGLMLRLIRDAETPQVVFYRNLLVGATIAVVLAAFYRSRFVNATLGIGRKGLLSACLIANTNILFVAAIMNTTVANTLILLATLPFWSAIFGLILIREPVLPRTWMTLSIAFIGIIVIFVEGLGGGTWRGDLMAVAAAASSGLNLVVLRKAGNRDMTPALALAGGIGALVTLPFAAFFTDTGLAVTGHDARVLGVLGVIQLPLALGLFISGTRYVAAAEIALLALLETVLGPVWAWLGVGEVPTPLALVGGGIVVAAVALNATLGIIAFRRSRKHARTRGSGGAHVWGDPALRKRPLPPPPRDPGKGGDP